jgi:beta-galactosidase
MKKRAIGLCVVLGALVAGAQSSSYQTPHAPLLGSAWYPEQWPESQWDADLSLMEQAHMNVVRVGEFAWSTIEPSEGHFELGWLDRAISLAATHHIAVVIGTPTDAPPAWLTTKYPETLGTNSDGHVREHGNRRQFNYANPKYRALCAQIVLQLAKHFGSNPDVIGWQIGNEDTDESFDPATKAQFQDFLRDKYKTLVNLNNRWSTAYWSEAYDRWNEIPMENSGGNPGLLLDHKHFVTETWRSFQLVQINVLRRHVSARQFITTNIGGLGWSDNWDHYAMTKDLDLASWDDYVGEGHLDVSKNAMLNDFARGWKQQNFWVMETQPGSVNWAPINNSLARGETRALAWQAIGHGADAILYWQWRDALNGQEQYHGAVVGPDGKPLPLYPELRQLGEDFQRTSTALAGTNPHSDVVILHGYDSRWAIDFQPHTKLYDQQAVLLRFYKPLEDLVQSVDVIEANADLMQYKFVVAPSLNVISVQLAAHLADYVKEGGHLLLGPRSGMKDEFNALNPKRQPGPLASSLGGYVDQYYALEEEVPIGERQTGNVWAEDLIPTGADTHVDLRYGKTNDGWLDGQPAMISRQLGKGTISYLGTLPDDATMMRILKAGVMAAGVKSIWGSLPDGIELCRRVGISGTVYILINHRSSLIQMPLPMPMHNLLDSDRGAIDRIDLPSQGIAVLTAEIPK